MRGSKHRARALDFIFREIEKCVPLPAAVIEGVHLSPEEVGGLQNACIGL